MSVITVNNIMVSGIVTVVGPEERFFEEQKDNYSADLAQMERIKKTVGLGRRSVSPEGVTALDMGKVAAIDLIENLNIEKGSIDGLIFVTQTPDHRSPNNAQILHGSIGLSKHCIVFDVNLGCSGWVYGLYLSSVMLSSGCRKILLVAGDTLSRLVNPRDRGVAPLFGDASAAAIIEKTDQLSQFFFSLGTDGTGWQHLCIPAGGSREPFSMESSKAIVDEEGNYRSRNDLYMNGAEVFNFTLREVPRSMSEVLEASGRAVSEIDGFILHQANKFILTTIARKLKIPQEKMPAVVLEKYGNQSAVSIPAVICESFAGMVCEQPNKLIISGFGVGLSWGSAYLEQPQMSYCKLFTYKG